MLIDINPDQHYLVFWGLDQTLQEKREPVVRVLAALIDAIGFINDDSNRDEVVQIGTVTGHSEEVVRQSLEDFLELEFWPFDRDGLTQEKIEATIREQVRLENIAEEDAPSFEDVIEAALWAEAYELVQSLD